MILESLTVGFTASNCFIVGSESTKRGMIIDPGAEAKTILKAVKDLGLSIPLIVATHTHADHIGALRAVKEETGAEFAIHEDEKSVAYEVLSRIFAPLMGGSFSRPPEPERLLKDGDTIDIDDLHFTVFHTPGHSPGGISLYGHGVVFCGDTLFNFSIGRTDFPGCSHTQLMNSIYSKLMTLPDDTVVYPGHGPETTIGTERRVNPFLHG